MWNTRLAEHAVRPIAESLPSVAASVKLKYLCCMRGPAELHAALFHAAG
eukprot:SAG31_NODE_450_length_15512_cov_5.788555_11_plen_49_part_00